MAALLTFALCAVASAILTRLAIAYAHISSMHDHPGARRMHSAPVARGAGIGFVATMVALLGGFGWVLGDSPHGRWAVSLCIALTLVATISWIDDRRGLPVLPRLLAHLVAATLIVVNSSLPMVLWPLAILAIVASINFWNFIDGINGMAGLQFVLLSIAVLVFALGQSSYLAVLFAAGFAGAVAGFLPSNFPQARGFMGDVGSASLGLLAPSLSLMPAADGIHPATVVALSSAVLIDTGLTLTWRMARRRRRFWYTAHREHLYQWITRAGMTHTQTTLIYSIWTLGPATFAAWQIQTNPDRAWVWLIGLTALGAAIWSASRPRVLAQVRNRRANR